MTAADTPRPTELTDAERETLGIVVIEADNADESLAEWHPCVNCPSGPCPCSGRPWAGRALTEAVARIKADAYAAGAASRDAAVGDGLRAAVEALVDELEANFATYRCDDPIYLRLRAALAAAPAPTNQGDQP